MVHIEFLVEEPSAEAALKVLLPKILGEEVDFNLHAHSGKSDLLRKLPNRLRGYRKWVDDNYKIVVLIDQDNQDCRRLKQKLNKIANDAGFVTKSSSANRKFQVINRIAVEELEAWFFGDVGALISAYPGVDENIHNKAGFRDPDAIRGGTWERLEKVLQKAGYSFQKTSVATKVSKYMIPERNRSKSFQVFISGLKAITK